MRIAAPKDNLARRRFYNILVVRTDRVGDLVLTTPVFQALRRAYPEARITLLCAAWTRPLVEGDPCLDAILVDDRQRRHRGTWGFWRLVFDVRREGFDLALILHTKRRTNALCFLAGIPTRVGYGRRKWGGLATHILNDERPQGKRHEVDYGLELARFVTGRSFTDWRLRLALDAQAEQRVAALWKKRGWSNRQRVVAVHPGASDPSKQWPAARFQELIDWMRQRYAVEAVVIGGREVQGLGAVIASKGRAVDLTGKTTLAEMVSVLRRCHLLVSNDSGPVHVAAALGIGVVSIFTRNQPGINPERWAPLGKMSRVVAAKRLSLATADFRKARLLKEEEARQVSLAEVRAAVEKFFE